MKFTTQIASNLRYRLTTLYRPQRGRRCVEKAIKKIENDAEGIEVIN